LHKKCSARLGRRLEDGEKTLINAAHTQLKNFSEAHSVSAPPFWDGKAAKRIVGILANSEK
jgi:hypothetical protein